MQRPPVLEAAWLHATTGKSLRLAFLAPDLQHDILAGRQPPPLTLEGLRCRELPLCWREQCRVFGWPAHD